MNIQFTGKYKSLTSFNWQNIPPFVVITGPNGTGKSQLLDLIQHSLGENAHPEQLPKALITNIEIRNEQVVSLKSEWTLTNLTPIGLVDLQNERGNLYNSFADHYKGYRSVHDYHTNKSGGNKLKAFDVIDQMRQRSDYTYLKKVFDEIIDKHNIGEPLMNDITRNDFYDSLPSTIIPELKQQITNSNIGKVFYAFYLKWIDAKLKGISEEQFSAENNEKPWVTINNIFKDSKIPYFINSPEGNTIYDMYTPILTSTITNEQVNFQDLSSGEQVLTSLVFWLFNSKNTKAFPKLLLLDEPDAHLHPSMTKQFIDVVHGTLVKEYGIRVIMTTHSPSTVAITPDDCLFEMTREGERIRKVTSKSKLISSLTAGLIIVTKNTKNVLVEDKDDATFYSELYNILTTEINTLTKQPYLNNDIPLNFIAASNEKSNSSGGNTVVKSWIEKLRLPGIDSSLLGLIDLDKGTSPSILGSETATEGEGIFVLNRYSIENYWLDPILTYAVLLNERNNPPITGVDIKPGEQRKLVELSQPQLQAIADTIISAIIPTTSAGITITDEKQEVKFINDIKLNYPVWLLKERGKDLLRECSKPYARGDQRYMHLQKFTDIINKVPFIPKDIVDLFERIQNS